MIPISEIMDVGLAIPFLEPMLPYFIREKKIFMAAQAPGSHLDLPNGVFGVFEDKFRGLNH